MKDDHRLVLGLIFSLALGGLAGEGFLRFFVLKINQLNKFTITIKTQFGLEPVLAAELNALGVTEIETLNRAVQFTGNQELLYKCNLHLRTALRVLKPIVTFQANNERQLYERVRDIRWNEYLTPGHTFAIDGTSHSEVFKHSKFIALKTKDAIADQFRDRYGRRPSVDTRDPDLRINLHIYDRTCTLSLDSSGMHLDRRGYRLSRTEAPINEVLAAGIILLTGWDGSEDFIDPMCGSGTFPIEAALLARRIPPGRGRTFIFEKWKDFDAALWKKIKLEAETQIQPFKGKILACDLDAKSLEMAVKNAERAGVRELIEFKKQDFLQSEAPSDSGVVVMNPPYGERIEVEEIKTFYGEIGTRLKHHYAGYDAWIISSDIQALKFVGLRPSRKVPLYNGSLECRLHKFELYQGSKKVRDEG